MSLANTPGFGATIKYGNTDYTSPIDVTGVIEIEPPKTEVDYVQNSNFATAGQTHTYQPAWIKPGKLKVTINWDNAQVAAIEAIVGVMKGWIITLNDGTAIGGTTSSTIKFKGFIVASGSKVPMEKLVTYEFEIQQSGAKTFTAGS